MKKCDCYHTELHRRYTYNPMTGAPIGHDVEVGVCWGTKECEECSCGGNETKCDFYPEVRKKGRKKREPKFGEWTSVEDRLPEENVTVLCYFGDYIGDIMNVYTYKGDEVWEDDYGYFQKYEPITHWMPLPEPPKGE